MTAAEIGATMDKVLDDFDFTHPVALEDVMAVHGVLKTKLGDAVRLESYHKITEVVITARCGDATIQRTKKVITQ